MAIDGIHLAIAAIYPTIDVERPSNGRVSWIARAIRRASRAVREPKPAVLVALGVVVSAMARAPRTSRTVRTNYGDERVTCVAMRTG